MYSDSTSQTVLTNVPLRTQSFVDPRYPATESRVPQAVEAAQHAVLSVLVALDKNIQRAVLLLERVPKDSPRSGLALFRSRNEQVIVKPGTVIRWHRRGLRLYWPAAALAS